MAEFIEDYRTFNEWEFTYISPDGALKEDIEKEDPQTIGYIDDDIMQKLCSGRNNEMHTWIIKNCHGKFNHWSWLGSQLCFEFKDDAMAFKLRWL